MPTELSSSKYSQMEKMRARRVRRKLGEEALAKEKARLVHATRGVEKGQDVVNVGSPTSVAGDGGDSDEDLVDLTWGFTAPSPSKQKSHSSSSSSSSTEAAKSVKRGRGRPLKTKKAKLKPLIKKRKKDEDQGMGKEDQQKTKEVKKNRGRLPQKVKVNILIFDII